MADIVAWIRPWDGDESDFGNMLAEPVIDEDTTPPADGHEWFPCVLKADHEAALAAAVVAERDRCVDIINAYATVCDRSPEMLMDIARGAAHE